MWPRMHFLDLQQLDRWLNDWVMSPSIIPAHVLINLPVNFVRNRSYWLLLLSMVLRAKHKWQVIHNIQHNCAVHTHNDSMCIPQRQVDGMPFFILGGGGLWDVLGMISLKHFGKAACRHWCSLCMYMDTIVLWRRNGSLWSTCACDVNPLLFLWWCTLCARLSQ